MEVPGQAPVAGSWCDLRRGYTVCRKRRDDRVTQTHLRNIGESPKYDLSAAVEDLWTQRGTRTRSLWRDWAGRGVDLPGLRLAR